MAHVVSGGSHQIVNREGWVGIRSKDQIQPGFQPGCKE